MRISFVARGSKAYHLPPLGRSLIASRSGRRYTLDPYQLVAELVLALFFVVAGAGKVSGQEDGLGKVTYDRWCAGCHGVDGDGTGVAAEYMLPRPRDFTRALY